MKLLLGILSVLGATAYGSALVRLYDPAMFEAPQVRAASIGLAAGGLLWLALGRKLRFFGVFEHELTHLVFGLLMFQKPRSFYASEYRGSVTSDRGNFLDGLAPYFFPTYSYLLLALYPALRPEALKFFYPVLGLLTGYHVVSNLGEFKPAESDIRKYGVAFSLLFCAFAGILTLGFLMAFVKSGPGGGLQFIKSGPSELVRIAGHLRRTLGPL
jgi:hypothetical protein